MDLLTAIVGGAALVSALAGMTLHVRRVLNRDDDPHGLRGVPYKLIYDGLSRVKVMVPVPGRSLPYELLLAGAEDHALVSALEAAGAAVTGHYVVARLRAAPTKAEGRSLTRLAKRVSRLAERAPELLTRLVTAGARAERSRAMRALLLHFPDEERTGRQLRLALGDRDDALALVAATHLRGPDADARLFRIAREATEGRTRNLARHHCLERQLPQLDAVLMDALADRDRSQRHWAIHELGRRPRANLGGALVEALRRSADDSERAALLQALLALPAAVTPREVVPIAEALLSAGGVMVPMTAAELLGQVATTASALDALHRVGAAPDSDESVAHACKLAASILRARLGRRPNEGGLMLADAEQQAGELSVATDDAEGALSVAEEAEEAPA